MYPLWLQEGLFECSTNCGTWYNLYVLSLAWKMTTKQAAFFIWMDDLLWSQILNSLFEIPMFKVSAMRGSCLHWTYKWLNYTDISDSKKLFYPPILSSQPGSGTRPSLPLSLDNIWSRQWSDRDLLIDKLKYKWIWLTDWTNYYGLMFGFSPFTNWNNQSIAISKC